MYYYFDMFIIKDIIWYYIYEFMILIIITFFGNDIK